MTGAGACVVEAGAAPDLLRALLRDCRGPDAHPVKDFFQVFPLSLHSSSYCYFEINDMTDISENYL